jgi:hypothetical protein
MKNENEFEYEGNTYIREEIEGNSCDGCEFNGAHVGCSNDIVDFRACTDTILGKNFIFKAKQ